MKNLLSSSLLSKNKKIKMSRTIIFPVVLYGCETWSLTLREERRLRVSENKLLRSIFGPKMDKVIGEWSKLHDDIEKNEMGGTCSTYEGEERCIQGFGGETTWKIQA